MVEATLSRRERKKLEARERIVEAARLLFEAKGYEATTVNEIALQADIGYGTFFQHFPAKVDLLRELADDALRTLFANVEEIRKTPGGFREHLVGLFERAAEVAEERGETGRELMSAMLAQAYPVSAVADDSRMRALFTDLLRDGADEGVIRPDVELEVLLEITMGTWASIFQGWVHFDDYPLRARASGAARFLAQTLTTPTEA